MTGLQTNPLTRPLNQNLNRKSLDADVLAFAAASGATDLAALDALTRYVKAEELWDNFRAYPMKSTQNAGSGATVYGLGGLTANNMTLVNAPSWGAGGINFAGTTQYGNTAHIPASPDVTVFTRANSLWGATANQNSVVLSAAEAFNSGGLWLSLKNFTDLSDIRMSALSTGTKVLYVDGVPYAGSYSAGEHVFCVTVDGMTLEGRQWRVGQVNKTTNPADQFKGLVSAVLIFEGVLLDTGNIVNLSDLIDAL